MSALRGRPGVFTCCAGSVAGHTFDAGPMLTLVEFRTGELCLDRTPESGIVSHPFWGLSRVERSSRLLDSASMPEAIGKSPMLGTSTLSPDQQPELNNLVLCIAKSFYLIDKMYTNS